MSNLNTPVRNTPYDKEELEYFKDLLLEVRQETTQEIKRLKQSVEDQRSLDDDRSSSQAHHPGNIGSEEEEKETDLILNERYRNKLKEIDAALERIENNTYGVCEDTGEKIQQERLEAIPYTRYCVEASKKDSPEQAGPLGQ